MNNTLRNKYANLLGRVLKNDIISHKCFITHSKHEIETAPI